MILIVNDENRDRYSDALDEAFRLRHRILVDGEGWSRLRRGDGREIDQFDGPGSVHFLAYEGRRLAGYQRMLPTTQPYLLSAIYPQLCDSALPSDPSIWEWTRIAVEPDRRGRNVVGPTAIALVLAMVEWCVAQGVGKVILETAPTRILSLLQLHLRVYPLGVIHQVDGVDTIALEAHYDERTVNRLRLLLEQARVAEPADHAAA